MHKTSAYDALSTRHRAFVDAYIVRGFNATEAYRATYGSKTTSAATNGPRLIRNDQVAAAVKERLDADAMDATETLGRLSRTARNTGSLYLRGDGTYDLEAMLADGQGDAVKGVQFDREGRAQLQFHDAQKALTTLARIHGLFAPKRVEVSTDPDLSKERISKLTADLHERASRFRGEYLAERAAGRLSPERMAKDAKERREEDEADAAARLRTGK